MLKRHLKIYQNYTKGYIKTSIKNNKAVSDLKENVWEKMNDKGMIAPYLSCSLVNLLKPENKSQLKLIKDHFSVKMNDFLINTSIPVTLYSNMLTFRDSDKSSKLDGYLLETITNYDFKIDHSNQQQRKLFSEFGKEIKFDNKQTGRKSDRDKSLIRLLKSIAIMAFGISSTCLPSNPNEICNRRKLLLQQ